MTITTKSSRRSFLARGIAVSTIAAAPLTMLDRDARAESVRPMVARDPSRNATPTAHTGLPTMVIFEREAAAGPAFAAAATGLGAEVTAIGNDPGRAWRDLLEPQLRQGAVAIAGLTTGAPLFCLDLLARDYGLRPVFRIEHVADAEDSWRHTFEGPAALVANGGALASDTSWVIPAATLAAHCRFGPDPLAPLALLDLGARPGRATTYFTWRLAPAANAMRQAARFRADRGRAADAGAFASRAG